MSKDERIHELVLPECDDSYWKYASEKDQDKFNRCTCGSSLVRVITEEIIDDKELKGYEYSVVCAKCGCHVFGFTNRCFEEVFKHERKEKKR